VKRIQEISEKESTKAEKKASTTFRDLRYMIWIAFIFGLALIVVAIGLFIFEERSLEVLGLSTLGVADWIALFIYKPMDRLQKATADYAQLVTLLKGWAASINLQFFAMNSKNEESVRTSAKKIQEASIEVAKTFQEYVE